jgi:hypothetical protein
MHNPKGNSWIRGGLLVWLIALVAAPSVSAKVYMTDGFRNNESRPMTLVLLPPHADLVKRKAFSKKQLPDAVIGASAAASIAEKLGAKGYTVRVLTAEELEESPGLRELVRKVNDRYGKAKIVKKPEKAKRGRCNLGDDARKLCSMLGVDGILLARVRTKEITAGRQVLKGSLGIGLAIGIPNALYGASKGEDLSFGSETIGGRFLAGIALGTLIMVWALGEEGENLAVLSLHEQGLCDGVCGKEMFPPLPGRRGGAFNKVA